MQNHHQQPDLIVYEYPLSERMRTFLRLEFLFDQYRFGVAGESVWHTRSAVAALLDVMALLTRSDIRSELQKELDRVGSNLKNLQAQPQVDGDVLQPILDEGKQLAQQLREAPTGLPSVVASNEFLSTIEQRAGILGGTCAFDLAGYHLWLESPAAHRQAQLQTWHGGFALIDQGTAYILRLLRGSADPVEKTAANGSYQAMLDRSTRYQLLRVVLPKAHACYPEISGSKHFCNIRFLHQPEQGERPQQVSEDVSFTLEQCVI